MTRRKFLERISLFFSILTAALLSLPVIRFIAGAVSGNKEEEWQSVLNLRSAPLGEEVTQVRYKKILRDGWMVQTVEEAVFVRKKAEGQYEVFDPHCTHLGCGVAWQSDVKQFHCPCHGGKFDNTGKKIAGPPPRPLDRYETRIDGNTLKIRRLISHNDRNHKI